MESWERLEKIIEWTGLSIHAFAMKIGLPRSENIYRVVRKKDNISIKLARLIINAYPQINKKWLIHRDGDMLLPISLKKGMPLFARTFDDTLEAIARTKPDFNISIPIFNDADIAITVNEKAMEPIINPGSIIVLKRQVGDVIIYGRIYYIEIEGMIMIRVVRKVEHGDDEIALEAINKDRYDTITIKRDKIKILYLVCGVINKFN